jgi:hypothetical protein
VSTATIKHDMERAGYTKLATQLALTRLTRMNFIAPGEESDYNGNPFVIYRMLEAGENWLLDNQNKLELRRGGASVAEITDDEIPF